MATPRSGPFFGFGGLPWVHAEALSRLDVVVHIGLGAGECYLVYGFM